jgi:hypothetical protein
MNELITELYNQARNEVSIRDGILTPGELRDKFAELIIRECMRMCDVAAVGYETHGHMKEANGCSSAKEYIEEHFGLEERTPSQKMADAGYTRRPKGWTKEGEE